MPESKAFWNKRARKYDRKLYKGPNYAARLERAAEAFGLNASVLDVGCATGEITLDLAQHCKQILGIDHAQQMIDEANRKAEERGIDNCRFRAIDAYDDSLAPDSFDAVTNYSLLHLVEDPPGAPATVERFHDLLKPGGHLLTEAPCLGDWNVFWRIFVRVVMLLGFAPPVRCYKRTDYEAMLRGAGFELLETKVYNPKSGMTCFLARKNGD